MKLVNSGLKLFLRTTNGSQFSRRFKSVEIACKKDFKSLIEDQKGLNVAKFYANWCEPCKTLKPIFEEISDEFSQAKFYSINADNNEDIIAQYQISVLPTMIVFIDGHPVKTIHGIDKIDSLKAFILQNTKSTT